MQRLPNWQNRLATYVATIAAEPFGYGAHDCALFSAGAVEAMTGVDLARGFRGYSGLKSGLTKLRARGFDSLVAFVADHLLEVPPLMAVPGDIVLLEGAGLLDGLALGVLQGRMVYAVTSTGLGLVPRTFVTRAFHV